MTRKFSLAAALSVCVCSASGCFALLIGAAAGAGGFAYVNGVLEKEFSVTSARLREATVRGLEAMDVPVSTNQGDKVAAQIRSTFADGKALKVDVHALTERKSKIRIRVGVVGDVARSEMVLKEIEKYL